MKKKILVLLVVLVLLAPSLFAQKMKGMGGIGVSYMNTTRYGVCYGDYDGFKVNVTSNIPSINGFIYIGDFIGFYGSINVGVPLDRTDKILNSNGEQSSSYYTDNLASTHNFLFLDAILGIGTNLNFGDTVGLLIGAGLDYSMFYLEPKDGSMAPYIDQLLGVGADARIWVAITPKLCFDVGITVSYDFLKLWSSEGKLYENTKFEQALNMGINVGLALKI